MLPEPYATVSEADLCASTPEGFEIGVIAFSCKALDEKSALIKKFYTALDSVAPTLSGNISSKAVAFLGLPKNAVDYPLPKYTAHTLPSKESFEAVCKWLGVTCDYAWFTNG